MATAGGVECAEEIVGAVLGCGEYFKGTEREKESYGGEKKGSMREHESSLEMVS